MRNDKMPPTGMEEDWPTKRMNLLRALFTSASYLADVAHSNRDLPTAELATEVMDRTIHLESYAQRKVKETE